MQFDGAEAERCFLHHFHTQRITQDRVFAATQAAIAVLLALQAPAVAAPALRLLFWGTQAVSCSILALSTANQDTYASLRPYLLVAARLFYDLLCPQLVWQHALLALGKDTARDDWPAFFLLWVTWSRWGSQLLARMGYLLPFNVEGVLTPFGTLLDMLNNRRLCRLLTVVHGGRRPFFSRAFTWLSSWLSVPFAALFAADPADGCRWGDGGDGLPGQPGTCAWSWCAAAAAATSPLSGGTGSELLAACHCESVFGLSQLALSLALPLGAAAYAEARQRRAFAAAQMAAREQGAPRRRRRAAERTAPWILSFDSLRLLALLAVIQLRLFISLRFGIWQQYSWARESAAPPAAAPPHAGL